MVHEAPRSNNSMSQTPLHSAPRCCLCFDFQLKSIFESVSVITQVFTTPRTEIERGLGGDLYTGVDAHTHTGLLSLIVGKLNCKQSALIIRPVARFDTQRWCANSHRIELEARQVGVIFDQLVARGFAQVSPLLSNSALNSSPERPEWQDANFLPVCDRRTDARTQDFHYCWRMIGGIVKISWCCICKLFGSQLFSIWDLTPS
jgi:hypothetical protein